jgi:hypothetical protein
MEHFQMSPDCELALAADLQLGSKIDQLVA